MIRFCLLLAMTVGIAFTATARSEEPRVVVSIKPIHALAAALLDGVAEPVLLLDGASSPHSYALRPSERRALQEADAVIWVGPELESFLVKPLSLLPEGVRIVGLLADTQGLERLALDDEGSGHGHEAHGHERHDHGHAHDHNHDHAHGDEAKATNDPHIWLSPANARAIARHLATVLAPWVPEDRLARNAAALDQRLTELEASLADKLAPVQDRPFVVFHPAYGYFVKAFGLHQAGTITTAPEHGAGARHLSNLREKIAETGAVCAFREPQFAESTVEGLTRDTGLRLGVLDPLGADVPSGPGAYEAILRNLADAFADCLGAG